MTRSYPQVNSSTSSPNPRTSSRHSIFESKILLLSLSSAIFPSFPPHSWQPQSHWLARLPFAEKNSYQNIYSLEKKVETIFGQKGHKHHQSWALSQNVVWSTIPAWYQDVCPVFIFSERRVIPFEDPQAEFTAVQPRWCFLNAGVQFLNINKLRWRCTWYEFECACESAAPIIIFFFFIFIIMVSTLDWTTFCSQSWQIWLCVNKKIWNYPRSFNYYQQQTLGGTCYFLLQGVSFNVRPPFSPGWNPIVDKNRILCSSR